MKQEEKRARAQMFSLGQVVTGFLSPLPSALSVQNVDDSTASWIKETDNWLQNMLFGYLLACALSALVYAQQCPGGKLGHIKRA